MICCSVVFSAGAVIFTSSTGEGVGCATSSGTTGGAGVGSTGATISGAFGVIKSIIAWSGVFSAGAETLTSSTG